MAFNLPGNLEKFAVIAEVMGEIIDGLPLREAAWLAVEAVTSLIEDCGVYTTLEDLNIPKEAFPELAKVAMTVARPLANNPRKLTIDDAIEIYEEAY
jgi:alcohol dehydrogenase